MENLDQQPQQADNTEWIEQANRESLEALNAIRAEEGLSPLEFSDDREEFDIDDYTGQFYD